MKGTVLAVPSPVHIQAQKKRRELCKGAEAERALRSRRKSVLTLPPSLRAYIAAIIASPISRVPTAVGSSRLPFMS